MNFDVFNGDADGICALLQLRLAEPTNSILITGVKRDISLLQRVDAKAGDKIVVLDVSLDKNRKPLLALLERQVEVLYVDHHQATDVPTHPLLQSLINTDANICTSLLVDQYLNHRYTAWAVVAAFGDNLTQSAINAAKPLGLSASQLERLRQLGVGINYNAYGENIDDLHFSPETLYRTLSKFASPFDFMVESQDVFQQLLDGYRLDMALAENTPVYYQTDKVAVFILPDAKWSRRVIGVWSNALANASPHRAHAVLTHNATGGYTVSARSPLNNPVGADLVCGQFPGGGGRKAAAGINNLLKPDLDRFINCLIENYRY